MIGYGALAQADAPHAAAAAVSRAADASDTVYPARLSSPLPRCIGLIMAWLLNKSIAEVDSPHVRWSEDSRAERERLNAAAATHFNEQSTDPTDFVDPRGAPVGIRQEAPSEPIRVNIPAVKGRLPDALTPDIVNDRIKNIIEACEPGVHQFFPTIVTLPNGEEQSWWSMHCCVRVDALLKDACPNVHEYHYSPTKHPARYYYIVDDVSPSRSIVLQKGKIADFAFWYDYRLMMFFCNEDVAQQFIEQKITGFDLPNDLFGRSLRVQEIG